MAFRFILTAACLILLSNATVVCIAQNLAPIVFPDVEGWVKGTRYDEEPPRRKVPRSTINYTTKDKVGKDYIRADVEVNLTAGKEIKELLPDFEKKILENPV